MAEMNRNQQQGGNRRGNQGMDGNRDMQDARSQQQSGQSLSWDGHERRTGAERRTSYGSAYDSREMNEGSSR